LKASFFPNLIQFLTSQISQTITLLQKVKNVRIAAVSARVLKLRINKHDREKWGKASQLRNSFLSRDLEGSWSGCSIILYSSLKDFFRF